jgi:hypothetical protein
MKSAAAGTVSGCVVWMIVFCVMSMCLLTAAMPVGAITATTSDVAVDVLGPYLCPPNSTGEIITHPSTSTDSNGNRIPSTAYEMQCVNSDGVVVQAPSPDYAFIWVGVMAVAALLISVLLAFLLAAPAGVLIASLVNRLRKSSAR